MKNLLLLILMISIISACQSGEETKSEVDIDTVNTETPDVPAAPAEGAGVSELTVSDEGFFINPFMDNYKVQQLRSRHNDFKIISKEPVENRHIKGQIDTIITAEANNSTFTIYKAKQDELLQKAEIRGSSIELKNGIRVGMTNEDFNARFNQIEQPIGPNATVTLNNPTVPSSFIFRFNNNRLEQISFNGYVD